MKLEKICKTCEFNFSGICTGYGNDKKIDNNIIDCEAWEAGFEYYSTIINNAPWYIKEQYESYKIDYDTFIQLIEDDNLGKAIDINIYNVIEKVYGLSSIQLANILDVSVGVITYAKNRGTVAKRVHNFSKVLCIPEKYFKKCTSLDIKEIEKCKLEFENSIGYKNLGKEKNKINNKSIKKVINLISECLDCSVELATEFTSISRLEWSKKTKLNNLTAAEKKLVLYIINNKIVKGSKIHKFTYMLDGNNIPKLNIIYKQK